MSIRSNLKLPKEHGAWAMLYVPFVLGLVVAGAFKWRGIILLFLSITALFISRESLLTWWRAKSRGREAHASRKMLIIYLSLAAITGVPLIVVDRLYWLIPLGAFGVALLLVNGKLGTQMEERSTWSELMAIGGLTLTAPATYYVAGGVWDRTAWWLWALSALYFASSVFYVKWRVVNLNPRKQEEQRRVRQSCAVYHGFLLLALLVLPLTGNLHHFVLIAFMPVFCRTFWSLIRPARRVNLARSGVLEIVYSLVFLIFIALSFRSA